MATKAKPARVIPAAFRTTELRSGNAAQESGDHDQDDIGSNTHMIPKKYHIIAKARVRLFLGPDRLAGSSGSQIP